MKTLAEFWNKFKFRIVLVGFILLLLYTAYKLIFGPDIEIKNPIFSSITNLDSIECHPLAMGGSGIYDDDMAKNTQAWAGRGRNDKFTYKWIAVKNEKIFVGSYISAQDGQYVNFGDIFDIVDQKDKNLLVGFSPNLTLGYTKVETLILDKTKGILAFSFNGSSTGNYVDGYNEVFACKEVPLSTLDGSKGLPN
jgi:hypothetical protein